MLAVHAHADDESITMGGTFAVLADAGVRTANVCCTDGSLATIVAKDLPEETTRPRLGEIRRRELDDAAGILGISEVHWLGYRDSGMAGTQTARDPGAFFMAPFDAVVERLVSVLRAFRPHVVVTYDGYGAYGHPDHVQAHRATLVAVETCHMPRMYPDAGAPWKVSKLYYTAMPRSVLQSAIDLAAAAGMEHPFDGASPEDLEFGTADELVTTSLEIRTAIARKRAALRAHYSQIDETFPMLSIPEEILGELFGTEYYQLALSRVPVELPETDLFAGVEVSD